MKERERRRMVIATVDRVKNSKIERKRDCSPDSEVSYSA